MVQAARSRDLAGDPFGRRNRTSVHTGLKVLSPVLQLAAETPDPGNSKTERRRSFGAHPAPHQVGAKWKARPSRRERAREAAPRDAKPHPDGRPHAPVRAGLTPPPAPLGGHGRQHETWRLER